MPSENYLYHPDTAAPLTAHAKIERMSEPWALNKTVAIAFTFAIAMLFGTWIGSGDFQKLAIVAIWLAATMIIVFVRDYWWSPPLVITAAGIGSDLFGLPLSGIEIGLAILCIAFPVKIAMKTLRKAEPEIHPGVLYWLLVTFVAVHCVVILFYNKIGGVPLKNVIKSYYQVLTPLCLYALLFRYCHVRTIRPTVRALFFINLFVIPVSLFVMFKGYSFDPFGEMHISFAWLDSDTARTAVETYGPLGFIGGLAYWPTMRSGLGKAVLATSIVLSLGATASGGGRLPLFCCIIAGFFFAVARGKLWMALPFVFCTALVSAVITTRPDVYFSLPPLLERSLAVLNFSSSADEVRDQSEGSNEWHNALRDRSLDYWTEDTTSFWLGHGYKSWDPSLTQQAENGTLDMDHQADIAVQMGRTENMFSSITNIFGLTGLILYGGFLIHLCWMLYRGCRLAPVGTEARALCEFSLVNLLPWVLLAPYMGITPGFTLIYWQLGVLAARPYLAQEKPARATVKAAPEIPAFARPAFAERDSVAAHRLRPGRA